MKAVRVRTLLPGGCEKDQNDVVASQIWKNTGQDRDAGDRTISGVIVDTPTPRCFARLNQPLSSKG
jgi:hypothetical protein